MKTTFITWTFSDLKHTACQYTFWYFSAIWGGAVFWKLINNLQSWTKLLRQIREKKISVKKPLSSQIRWEISFLVLKEYGIPDNLSFLLNVKFWWSSSFFFLFLLKYGNCFSGMSIHSSMRKLWVLLAYLIDWYIEISVNQMNLGT